MLILETKDLSKRYDGVAALDGLSLGIEAGAVTAVIGPNGSGKSTLVNVLSGVAPKTGGRIAVSGVALGRITASDVAAYGITRTFQEVRLFNQMNVMENLLVVLTEKNVFGAILERHAEKHARRAEELLRKVNLWEKRSELAGGLSYGQRKLLEIARALASGADIYLFDEPFAGLFPEMVKIVEGVLVELRREGKTVVLIEHNMDLIRALADRVVVLDGGKLLAEGATAATLGRREVLEAYLGE